jgi:PPOX class probable F420-dependent enzyme
MNRRDLIKMTDDEVEEFIHGRRTMSIASLGPAGRIHVVAMWYGFLDGAPALWTYGKSQKVANLQRDPRCTGLVEDGEDYAELRGVELVGKGRVIEDRDVVQRVGESVYGRYFGELNDAGREAVAVMGAKRVVVRLDVREVVSWDHRKLAGAY